MGEIDIKTKLNIIGVGILSSMLTFFIIYTLSARVLTLTILDSLENDTTLLLFIILSLEFIAFISSIAVSFLLTSDIPNKYVIAASLIAYLCNLAFLVGISYASLFFLHPEIFQGLSGIEILIVFPTVLIYFSIFVLGHPIYLIILSIVSYYVFFIVFLERFYN